MKKFIIFCVFFFLYLPSFAVEVSTYSELQNAVNNNESTILLSQDINFGATPLVITTNTILTSLEGSTFTIKGNDTVSPMFTFNAASSTISNINFSSSTAAEPAVYINIAAAEAGQNYSTFTIEGVTFLNNTSSTNTGGGALNIVSEQGTYIYNTEFSTNYATGLGSNGGALYYQGDKGLVGEKIFAYYNSAQQNGGAIYASTATLTGSTFSGNSTSIGDGGAIYASSITVQDSTFSNNYAQQNAGAIYASTATIKNSIFTGNEAHWNDGGAIYVTDSAAVKDSSFLNNTATSGNGGAIYTTGVTEIANTTFENNRAALNGGAIYNKGTTTIYEGIIKNNVAEADGGAIYNEGNLEINGTDFSENKATGNGGAIYVKNGSVLTLNNSVNFINNTSNANGGAIYADNANIDLNLNGNTVTFRGNTDSSGSNDIYLYGSSTLNINGGGNINFHGGVKGGSIFANGANINWRTTAGYNGNLSLTGGALNVLAQNATAFNTVSLNAAALNIQNGAVDTFSPSSLNITGNIPLYIDADFAAGTVDTVNNVSGSGSFSINNMNQLNILTDTFSSPTFTVTSATLNVNEDIEFQGPVYTYNLQQTAGGFVAVNTGRLNTTISALPVAANSKVIANINTVNSLYNRIDVMLSREYLDYYDRNRLQDNPYVRMLEEEIASIQGESLEREWQKMAWFIPNAGYQKVNFGNEVGEVKNIFYGGLIGVDYPVWFSDTTAFIPTIFAGYLGSRQKYQDTTLDNNSLAFGGMLTFMKNFAILSAQAYVTNGSEEYKFNSYDGDFDIFSLTASVKGELNLNLADDIVMQPAFTFIYNLSNLQNYTTANHARINSARFHNYILTPSVKIMAKCNGWYPYIGASYNLSDKQKGSVTANDLTLSRYKLKNFGELSAGIENTFFKDYSGYVQVSAYTGSSKGVSFQMGLRGYLN